MRRLTLIALLVGLLASCSSLPPVPSMPTQQVMQWLASALPADLLLLGEQHDAPAHQQIAQQVISTLAARQQLAAVVVEMADAGTSTAALPPQASAPQVRQALQWRDEVWPWAHYGPAIMAAVQAGVPVLGGNVPTAEMPQHMRDSRLDAQLPGPALKAQQQAIRLGHCELLPEAQITPMTRLQIAKDLRMAKTLQQAVRPGRVVVLLAGSGHVNRQLGVPQHLPASLQVMAVHLRAEVRDTARTVPVDRAGAFDQVWSTPAPAGPVPDYCADLKARWNVQAEQP